MENVNSTTPRGPGTSTTLQHANWQGSVLDGEELELPAQVSGATPLEVPVVRLLQRAVCDVVGQQLFFLPAGCRDDGTQPNEIVHCLLRSSTLGGRRTFDALAARWRQILSGVPNPGSPVLDAEGVVSPVGLAPEAEAGNGYLEIFTDTTVNLDPSDGGVNVLNFDCDGELSPNGLLRGDDGHNCDSAHELIDRCLTEWLEDGRLVSVEQSGAFLRAVRTVCDGCTDVPVSDNNWDFWKGSLLACLQQSLNAWESVDLIVAFLYNRCSPAQKLLLIESIREILRGCGQQPSSGVSKEVCLHLLHKLVRRVAADVSLLLDDELECFFVGVMEVVADHITFFETVDPRGEWLKELLACPALTRHIVRLPDTRYDLVCKLMGALPTTHAVGLTLAMLPMWVEKLHTRSIFASLLSRLVEGVLAGTVRHDMTEDALSCVRRCVRGLHFAKRCEYVDQICSTLTTSKSGERRERSNYENSEVLLHLGLSLLLIFSVPSGHNCDKAYRLFPCQLKRLEKCLLKRSELWCSEHEENREVVSLFWCEMLRWYAVQLRKVVKHVLKAVGGGAREAGSPWDERHLVAISTVAPAWYELEKNLVSRRRDQAPDYTAVLQSMYCHGITTSFPLFRPQASIDSGQHGGYSLVYRKHELWWLLMRWCSSAVLRDELLIATGTILESLAGSEVDSSGALLLFPVEELEGELHVLHTLPPEEMARRRKVALFQSIRLWVATLRPIVDPMSQTRWDVDGALLKQINHHWVNGGKVGGAANPPFGDDSLLLLLCACTMGTLTDAVTDFRLTFSPELLNSLRQILLDWRGFDPVRRLLSYLINDTESCGVADILAHRFNAECESACGVEETYDPEPTTSPLPHTTEQKELFAFKQKIGGPLAEDNFDATGVCSYGMDQVLLLVLRLHGGDVAVAAAFLAAFPLSTWEAYGKIRELSVGVTESVRKRYPHVEDLLRFHGVDLYYLSLLCTGRWLRDPWRAADIARTSVDLFVRLGWEAWESTIVESLHTYVMMVHQQSQQHRNSLLYPWEELAVLPVSFFWTSCISGKFTLVGATEKPLVEVS